MLLVSNLITAQQSYRLDFKIKGMPDMELRLIFYYGDRQVILDSGKTDASGRITFMLDSQDEPGMYRLELTQQKGLDFVFNKEEVIIETDSGMGLENLVVLESIENKLFFDYYRHKLDLETRIEVLGGFLKYYPPVDSFYASAVEHEKQLSSSYKHYIDSILVSFPDMLVPRIIRLDQLPDITPGELDPNTAEYYRGTYFDSIDLTDSLILNTPLLPAKVIDYISLYIRPGASRLEQEKNFIRAIDSLMKFTEGGPRVREMIVNYLINGFQAYGFESVMTYLIENYVLGQSCVSDQQEEKLRVRVEGFKKLAIGSVAPDFSIKDSEGDSIKLSGNSGRKTLLIFWAGDCPHCEALMPELKKLYSQFGTKVRFIGVSVDKEEAIWKNALAKNGLPWINVAELQGWDGKIVQDYYIYATPTFLVLDPGLKILAKPNGMAELKGLLME
jgi:thiol-disulfide isomerase/thioredoxin